MATINPQYKLLLTYDISKDKYEDYYRYILGEFVPAMRELGLHMLSAWQVTYGSYPQRQVEFICESRETLRTALSGAHYQKLEARLRSYTTHFTRKLVAFEDRFQF